MKFSCASRRTWKGPCPETSVSKTLSAVLQKEAKQLLYHASCTLSSSNRSVSVWLCDNRLQKTSMITKNVEAKQKRWLETGALNSVEVALFCWKNSYDCWLEGKRKRTNRTVFLFQHKIMGKSKTKEKIFFYLLPKAKERDSAVLVLCSPFSCSTCSSQSQQNHWSLHWVHYTINFQNREIQV